MFKQDIKDMAAEQVRIIQEIYNEVAGTWALDDGEIMAVTLEIYRHIA